MAEDAPLRETWEAQSYSWAPRGNLLPVSAPGWRLPLRYNREDAAQRLLTQSFPADGIPSVLWEVLPALSEAAPGGWDHVLLGTRENLNDI